MFGTGLTGGNRVLFEFANGLIERGHEVTITSFGSETEHNWYPLKAKVNYVSVPFPKKIISYGLKRFFNLHLYPYSEIELLTRELPECDINVATYCFTAFAVYRSKKGFPFYHVQAWEPSFFNESYLINISEESYHLPLYKILNSSWLKKKLQANYPIVTPGINLNEFYPSEINEERVTKKILCLGKSIKRKGVWDLFESLKIVKKHIDDIQLVLFGNEPNLRNFSPIPCEYVINPSGKKLRDLYCSVDLLVMPSHLESCPLPPLEAMACGIPVVTTNCGTEDYAIHKENCLVVSPNRPKEMADAIITILNDEKLRNQLISNGLASVKKHTWKESVDKIEKIFIKYKNGKGEG